MSRKAKEKEPERQKAVRGTIKSALLLRMPEDLREESDRAAAAEGIQPVEWWRRAGRERLERQAKKR
ncbi:MAG: hypothetical protein ACT4TC_26725 [Myxococcaceae bacterium]